MKSNVIEWLRRFSAKRSSPASDPCECDQVQWQRRQARGLLLPSIYKYGAYRGEYFTPDEIEAVVECYIEAEGREGAIAASKMMLQFVNMPRAVERRDLHLSKLHSVSEAYRRSTRPAAFRFAQEAVALSRIHDVLDRLRPVARTTVITRFLRDWLGRESSHQGMG